MDQNYYDFISKECEDALIKNKEYAELEKTEADPAVIQEVVEITCYQRGYNNAIKMIMNSL